MQSTIKYKSVSFFLLSKLVSAKLYDETNSTWVPRKESFTICVCEFRPKKKKKILFWAETPNFTKQKFQFLKKIEKSNNPIDQRL
jgi:hypothetical protein